MILVVLKAGLGQVIGKLAVRHGLGSQAGIRTGLIQSQRIKGGKHPDIRQDGGIIFSMAVSVGGDIHDQRNVEMGTSVHNCLGVFSHLAV